MTQWYYADTSQTQQIGPMEAEALRQHHANGDLTSASLVWRPGMTEWAPLSSVADELGITILPEAPAFPPATTEPAPVAPSNPPASTTAQAAPAIAADDIVYAGFWKRFAAYVIDSTLLNLLIVPLGIIAGLVSGFGEIAHRHGGEALALILELGIYAVTFMLSFCYMVYFHASTSGATLGKKAVGIKVVRLDGSKLSYGRSIGRYFGLILSLLTLYIGVMMAGFTQRKQALHDMLCETLVVDRWAFTEHPERQRRELGTVTIVVLVLSALLTLLWLGVIVFAVFMALAGLMH